MSSYKSCQFINHYLCFNDSRIVYCTVGNQSKCKQYAVIKENYNGEPINWEELLNKIDEDKASFKRGEIIDSCKDCLMLDEKDWEKEAPLRKFKYVLFSNWYACNSACRYCWRDGKEFLIEDVEKNSIIRENDTYDIIPIVKDLIEKNLLAEDGLVDFAGGEPTMYYKFNEALKILVDANISKIIIHTNAIIYSEEIERAVRKGIAELLISVDAGTKSVHEKVKRVVSFDRVLTNLERYCKALQPENINKVRSKYVIVPDINDTKEEILLWIKKSKEIGVSELVLNADDCIFMKENINKEHLQKIKDLTDFFIESAINLDCRYHIYTNALNSYSILGHKLPKHFG